MTQRRHSSTKARTALPILLAVSFITILAIALPAQASGLANVTSPTASISPEPNLSPTAVSAAASGLSWLSFPNDPGALASTRNYSLLAGEFIFHGLVNASSCADGGIFKSGLATPCGETAAHDAVILWQNQFDQAIYDAAVQNGVPPFVLKNVIAQESQFWPANYPTVYGYSEVGLGHVTQMGADTLLRWNSDFYDSFCPTVYNAKTCKASYAWQPPDRQAVLRGAVMQALNADCGNCAGSIDLNRARASIPYIAATLKANYQHINWLLQGLTSRNPQRAFEGVDLWRFSIVGYNAGPGCITKAITETQSAGVKINWKSVSSHLETTCAGAVDYVKNITKVYSADPLALSNASVDRSLASQLVLTGLGIPLTTPTVEASATPVSTGDAQTSPTAPDPASTEPAPTESATPVPTESTPIATPVPTETAPPPAETVSGEVVVKFKSLVPQFIAESVIHSAGGEVQSQVDALDLTVVTAPPENIPQVLEALQNSLFVDYAEPNYSVDALYTPNDPGYTGQGYLLDMKVPDAWGLTRGEGVVVAVIDTGVDTAHPELISNIAFNTGELGPDANGSEKSSNGIDDDNDGYIDNWQGWNFVDSTPNTSDLNGHGTHSAGIIAAQMDNGIGLAGIAPSAKIMPLKALDDSGHGGYAQVAEAIIYAVDHGARVINLGFGGTANSDVLLAATNYAYDHNVVVIAAGGNSGTQTVYYPAANPNVIAVSALDSTLNLASFSTYGNTISLAAPGVDIYSTTPGGNYATMSGTSMSAAQVSGVTALLASRAQFDTVDKVREALFGTAFDLGTPGLDVYYGYGLVRALDALNYVPGSFSTPTPDPLSITPTPGSNGGVSTMAVGLSNASWVNIHSSAPGNQTGTVTSYGTYTAGAGTNRILLVAIIAEINAGNQAMTTLTATYGGVNLTQIASTHTTANREHVWVGYLLDAQIPVGSRNVVVTYNTGSATNTLAAMDIKVAMYTGVNQTTPFAAGSSNASISGTTTVTNGGTITYPANGLTFFVSGNGGTPATEAITATPVLAELNHYQGATQSSFAGASAVHAAGGTYAVNAISITFGGTTSARSAMVVGSLNPAAASTVAAGPIPWTNVHSSTPNNQTGTITSFGSYFAGTGTDRILIVAVVCEINTANQAMSQLSATYGGVALTQLVTTRTSTSREHVWIGYLIDSQIPAGVQDVAVTYNTNSATNTLASLDVKVAMYTGVDQTAPFTGSNANFATASATVATNAAINYVANGMTFYVVGNGGTAATGTVTATPALTEGNHFWATVQSSAAGESTVHASGGTYASGAISIAFTGTTNTWSALAVGSLNPSLPVPILTSPTSPYATVTNTDATLGATITSNNGSAISAYGTCWGTTTAPTGNCAQLGTTVGSFPFTFTQARTGLPANTQIFYRGYANNTSGRGYSPTGSFYTEPATQASVVNFTAVGLNGMTVNWTRGSGAGVIVLMKAGSPISTGIPVDGIYSLYTANAAYGNAGSALGDAYIVYKGTGTSVAVTGLAQGTMYYVAIYEYAGTIDTAGVDQGTNYKPNPATGNQTTTSLYTPPILTILSPSNGASFQQGTVIGFAGNATVQTNGDISSYIIWQEGATTLGTGSSFALSTLGVGTHTITVSVTDLNSNLTATTSLIVTITAAPNPVSPHDKFNGSTDQCSICHRPHAARDSYGALINSNLSPNDFCLSCHGADMTTVSTHSNADWVTAGGGNPRFEAQFELLCTQCHSPHGHDVSNSTNLNNMRANVRLNTIPLASADPESVDKFLTTGPVTFTATTGANSFDDGASAATARLCLACHNNSSNAGYPMTRHPGAANHGDGNGNYNQNNYIGKDCTTCHPHSLDSSTATRDGFSTTCRACHSMAQVRTSNPLLPARRQIVATFGQSPATSGDFVNRATGGSHHVAGNDAVTDADCVVCHEMSQHKQGTVRLLNQDTNAVLVLSYTATYPYVLGGSDVDNYETFCKSCHDADGKSGNTTPFSDKKLIPQINTSIWSASQHNVLKTGFNASCLDCHSTGHGSNKTYLQSKFSTATPWDWAYAGAGTSPADVMDQEENFCFKCHINGGVGINVGGTNNVQLAFTTAANANISGGTPLSYGYRQHNIAATYNVHDSKEVFSSLFGGANRHIECDDCHGPHEDKAGTGTAPAVKPENLGPTGVDPVYSGAGTPQKYNFVSQVTNEYQVCFKCHSSYTTLPTYTPYGWGCAGNPCATRALVPDGLRKLTRTANGQVQDTRDLASAFNPSNGSFHPVMAVGKNTAIAAASFVNGYTINSRVYCTDCHTDPNNATQGNGPHGSPLLHILTGSTAGATEYSTVSQTARNVEPTVPNTEVCFRCHAYATYVQNGPTANTHFQDGSNLHYRHMTNGQITGTTCYTCHNSHGEQTNQHLINFDTSVVTPNGGRTSETAWYQNGTNYSCNLVCHGFNHNPVSYTP